MPNSLLRIALVHGSKFFFFPFSFKSTSSDENFFSVVSNIVLWRDSYLLYRLSISLLLQVTYLEVRRLCLFSSSIDIKKKFI